MILVFKLKYIDFIFKPHISVQLQSTLINAIMQIFFQCIVTNNMVLNIIKIDFPCGI